MPADPFTPAELDAAESAALDHVEPARGHLQPWRRILRPVLDAVAPLIAARVRAQVAEKIAQAIEASPDGWKIGYRTQHAAIARAHATTPEDIDA